MSNAQPPKFFIRFFKWYANPQLQEVILGDLEEQFEEDVQEYGAAKAKRRYSWTVLRFFRKGIIKPIYDSRKLNFLGMFKHNFIISFRSFRRYKSSFLINLIGLSTGLASVFLILLWIQYERSVDAFNKNDDQLYRVMAHFQLPSKKVTWEYTSGRMASSFLEEYPEVVKSTRVNNKFFIPKGVVSFDEKFIEVEGQFADANVFDILSYELLIGDPKTVIQEKSSVIISKELAIKMFLMPELAIGKTIKWNSSFFDKSFVITGVFKAPPVSATRQFELMINYENLIEADQWADDWKGGYAESYIELAQGTDIDDFQQKIHNHYDDKIGNEKFTVFIQKYSDWYLYGAFEGGKQVGGRISNVNLFSYVALLIIIIAAINFINLSTAQASTKLKEIGVKKAMGSRKANLIVQFLTESLLMVSISMLFAIGLVYSALPFFNQIIATELVFNILDHLTLIGAGILLLGVIAGIYPALYLSSFKPISIMRGKLPSLSGENWMRKGLVIIQFTLSVIFIIGMLIVKSQLNFIQNKPLGYNKEHLLTFSGKGSEYIESDAFLSEVQSFPGVVNATGMAGSFLWGNDNQSGFTWGGDPSTANHLFKSPKIGYNTIETLELEIVAGRSFDPEFNDTPERIIINESAVKLIGLENPIGHKLQYAEDAYKEVIGVVKDFQYGSIHQPIEP
ncbi:MAG: ABC transporter permease, partial [Bacteroidota bacterium]